MAGVSMKDIKSRIRSMESTKQITKAMEMVAASKLRGAQDRAVSSRPYFETLYATMNDIADSTMDFVSPYLRRKEGKTLYIVIAGDRGLAGGYNSNVLKLAWGKMQSAPSAVLPIGKKALDFFRQRGAEILTDGYAVAGEVSVGDCFSAAKLLSRRFLAGEFTSVQLVYTHFASMLSQLPCEMELLPIRVSGQKDNRPKNSFSMNPARFPSLTRSCRNTSAAFCMARCASPSLPSRRPAAWLWTRPPRTPKK